MLVVEDLSEEGSWLGKVVIGMSRFEPADDTGDLVLTNLGIRDLSVGSEGVWVIVGSCTLISVDSHGSISLAV